MEKKKTGTCDGNTCICVCGIRLYVNMNSITAWIFLRKDYIDNYRDFL